MSCTLKKPLNYSFAYLGALVFKLKKPRVIEQNLLTAFSTKRHLANSTFHVEDMEYTTS